MFRRTQLFLARGTVKKWFSSRCYGFINCNGKDYFVHQSNIRLLQGSIPGLQLDQIVEFDKSRTRAYNVRDRDGKPLPGLRVFTDVLEQVKDIISTPEQNLQSDSVVTFTVDSEGARVQKVWRPYSATITAWNSTAGTVLLDNKCSFAATSLTSTGANDVLTSAVVPIGASVGFNMGPNNAIIDPAITPTDGKNLEILNNHARYENKNEVFVSPGPFVDSSLYEGRMRDSMALTPRIYNLNLRGLFRSVVKGMGLRAAAETPRDPLFGACLRAAMLCATHNKRSLEVPDKRPADRILELEADAVFLCPDGMDGRAASSGIGLLFRGRSNAEAWAYDSKSGEFKKVERRGLASLFDGVTAVVGEATVPQKKLPQKFEQTARDWQVMLFLPTLLSDAALVRQADVKLIQQCLADQTRLVSLVWFNGIDAPEVALKEMEEYLREAYRLHSDSFIFKTRIIAVYCPATPDSLSIGYLIKCMNSLVEEQKKFREEYRKDREEDRKERDALIRLYIKDREEDRRALAQLTAVVEQLVRKKNTSEHLDWTETDTTNRITIISPYEGPHEK